MQESLNLVQLTLRRLQANRKELAKQIEALDELIDNLSDRLDDYTDAVAREIDDYDTAIEDRDKEIAELNDALYSDKTEF